MNDYLNLGSNDDSAADSGSYLGGDGSYLGLEEPATAPAQPDPYGSATGSYHDETGYIDGGDSSGGGFLDSGFGSFDAPADSDYPAMDSGYGSMPTAPAAPTSGDLTVQAPYLDEVQPGASTLGGTRGDLTSLVLDVEVPVEVYFGDAALTVEEFLELGAGSVVELDHAIEAPIELRVRGKLVARGQLVTVNGNYGLRVIEMVEGR